MRCKEKKGITNIALVAHDNKKDDMVKWANVHKDILAKYKLFCTGTTGILLENKVGLKITKLQSGPLGGDLQIGAYISERKIDLLIFFWDPLEAQPHDPDIKALLRIAVVWNIPIACNKATANFIITSKLMSEKYSYDEPDYQTYKNRNIQKA